MSIDQASSKNCAQAVVQNRARLSQVKSTFKLPERPTPKALLLLVDKGLQSVCHGTFPDVTILVRNSAGALARFSFIS
jgi:hypothetical protein